MKSTERHMIDTQIQILSGMIGTVKGMAGVPCIPNAPHPAINQIGAALDAVETALKEIAKTIA